MLKKIGLAVLGLIVAVLVIIALQPTGYKVVRSTVAAK